MMARDIILHDISVELATRLCSAERTTIMIHFEAFFKDIGTTTRCHKCL